MKEKTRKIIEHFIKERHYFDWWSIGHLVFGMMVGLVLKLIGLPLTTSILASLCIFIFWEVIEPEIFEHIIKKKFKESRRNQIMDIIYGFIGFLAYWYLI